MRPWFVWRLDPGYGCTKVSGPLVYADAQVLTIYARKTTGALYIACQTQTQGDTQ